MADSADRESLLGIFLMEAWDTLATLEDGVGRLREADAPAASTLASLVIVTHRLRGAAGLHGFTRLSELAGVVEELLERLPRAPRETRRSAADFLADLVTTLKKVLDGIGAGGQESAETLAAFTARYPSVFSPAAAAARAMPPVSDASGGAGPVGGVDPEILAYFTPEATEHLETMTRALVALERGGDRDAEVGTLFRAVHTLKGAAYTVGVTTVGDLAHRIEDLLAAVREGRMPLTPAVVEGVFVGVDALRSLLAGAANSQPERPTVLDPVVEQLTRLLPDAPSPSVATPEPAAPPLVAATAPTAAPAPPAAPGFSVRPGRPGRERPPMPAGPGIRVNLQRLDSLMNLVGELVIARSRLDRRLAQLDRVGELLLASRARMARAVKEFERKPSESEPSARASRNGAGARDAEPSVTEGFAELEFDRYDDFDIFSRAATEISADLSEVQAQLAALVRAIAEDTAQIQRLTGHLRDEITRARMVPVGRLFARFVRQVREAGRAAGKTVVLDVSGESVEVDNTLIEQVADPLLHLVQNAIAHGIESADERQARGKPAHGTVHLRAHHRGAFIHVEVEDDGGGIDVERLRTEAVRQGLSSPDAASQLAEGELLDLMFLPGFSTAPEVTTAAGRGVGLDVVRTNVSRLNGEIDVETRAGLGTRFTLKLPLTVVISDALMVRASRETLAIPLNAIRLILLVRPSEIRTAGRRETIRVDDRVVDLLRLDRVLGLSPEAPPSPIPVVVLRAGGRSVAVAVSELGRKEEIVIKTLGAGLEVGPYGGATISGEGRVILLLDPVRLAELGEASRRRALVARPVDAIPTPAPSPAAETARRILLVDDSISVRKFVGHMLERAGFRVLTANDGVEALERLQEVSVDVVITDLEMPRMNGYELIEDLRRRSTTRGIRIVVLTTRAGEKHESLARRLGVEHYVTKPVDEHAFVRLVDTLTAGAAADAQLSGAGR